MYSVAGIANFQPSPENTDMYSCSKRTVAGVEGGRVREISYIAIVKDTASFITSFKKTAVEVKYRWPLTRGIVRENDKIYAGLIDGCLVRKGSSLMWSRTGFLTRIRALFCTVNCSRISTICAGLLNKLTTTKERYFKDMPMKDISGVSAAISPRPVENRGKQSRCELMDLEKMQMKQGSSCAGLQNEGGRNG